MARSKLNKVSRDVRALPLAEFPVAIAEHDGERRVQMMHRVFDSYGLPEIIAVTTFTAEEARSLAERLLAAADDCDR